MENKIELLNLSSEEKKEIIKTKTWGQLNAEYKAPDWCNFYEPLTPLGCWSLVSSIDTRDLFNRKCNSCPESKHYEEKKPSTET